MTYKAWFQCINGCPGQYSLLEIIYRCPTCGDLLEVRHDLEALKTRAAGAWIKLFDDRVGQNAYPYGSGVWAKKEWVVPFIDNEISCRPVREIPIFSGPIATANSFTSKICG